MHYRNTSLDNNRQALLKQKVRYEIILKLDQVVDDHRHRLRLIVLNGVINSIHVAEGPFAFSLNLAFVKQRVLVREQMIKLLIQDV